MLDARSYVHIPGSDWYDVTGRKIEVNQVIAKAHRYGSRVQFRVGIVRELGATAIEVDFWNFIDRSLKRGQIRVSVSAVITGMTPDQLFDLMWPDKN